MNEETYQTVRPVVRGILEAAVTLGPRSLLRGWRIWSRAFCAGPITWRSAFIAADSADFEAAQYEASDPRRQLAKAGAAAAWAAFHLGNPRMAQPCLVTARALAADFAQDKTPERSVADVPSMLRVARPRTSRP